jgi:methyl-accepting chemotaxis protein
MVPIKKSIGGVKMNRNVSVEERMKGLVVQALIFSAVAAVVVPAVVLLLSNAENATTFAIGGIVAAIVVIGIGALMLFGKAAENAKEMTSDAARLATAASAMAVGNFSERLRTDAASELGQIEGALAQLSQVHQDLRKDFDGLSKEKAAFEKSATDAENIAKALANGDLRVNCGRGALDELRRKMEALTQELSTAQNAVENAKKEIAAAKDATENAKRDAVVAREDATRARSEVSAANAEANAAKRDASNARREADRLAAQQSRPAFGGATAVKPATTTTTRPAATATVAPRSAATPASPKLTETPSSARLRSHDAPQSSQSVKITAPSASHIYDSRDFGKFM